MSFPKHQLRKRSRVKVEYVTIRIPQNNRRDRFIPGLEVVCLTSGDSSGPVNGQSQSP